MSNIDNQWPSWLKIIFSLLLLALLYWPISLGQFAMKWDMMDWFFPMRFLVGELLQSHLFPLWNPYTNLGYPLIIDPQSGTFYPITWLIGYLWGYTVYSIGFEYFLHILIGFCGFFRLGETLGLNKSISWVVAFSFVGGGFFVSNAQHLTWIISAAWLPWILLWNYRLFKFNNWISALGLSFGLFMMLMGGYPAFLIVVGYVFLLAFLIIVIKKIYTKNFRYLRQFFFNHVIFLVAFLLQSACFLRYFLESLSYINRTTGLSLENAQKFPFSPQSLISLVIPFATAGDSVFWQTDISMANGYFGLGLFAFGLSQILCRPNRKTIIIFIIALIFLGISFGDYFILRAGLYHYVPFMNYFKYPSLFRIFFMIGMLVLGGLGLQTFISSSNELFRKTLSSIIIILLSVLVISWVYLIFQNDLVLPESLTPKNLIAYFTKAKAASLFLISAPIQILFLIVLLWSILKQKNRLIYLLLVIDIFISVQINMFATIICEQPAKNLQTKLNLLPNDFPYPNKSLVKVGHSGNGSNYPIWYNENIFRKEIAQDGYNNLKLRAFVEFHNRPDKDQLLADPPIRTSPITPVKITHFTPNEVIVQSDSNEPILLQYGQMNYPGWQAFIDGLPVALATTSTPFINVKIPKGNHQIRIVFAPSHFGLWIGISIGSLIIVSLILLTTAYSKKD